VSKIAVEPQLIEESSSTEEWEEVGKKNKSSIILQNEFRKSPVTNIFGGMLRSIVRKKGLKSSVTLQPFHCLHLDITAPEVNYVEDALNIFMLKEAVDGYKSPDTAFEIQASKQITIDQLPVILILHLKRFAFDAGETHKVHKIIEYEPILNIQRKLISSERVGSITRDQRKYRLFAVISHHGKKSVGGHYTCDIRQQMIVPQKSSENSYTSEQEDSSEDLKKFMLEEQKAAEMDVWIRYDDSSIIQVPLKKVLHQQAYLLFYQQCEVPVKRKV